MNMKGHLDIDSKVNKAIVTLREPKFRLKDLGVSSPTLTHWQQQGILIEGQMAEGRKWRQLNLVDWVWLNIIIELREIGLPLKRIRELAQWLKIEIVKLNKLIKLKERIIILDTLEFLILYSLVGRIPINILFFTTKSKFPFTIQIPEEFLNKAMELEFFYAEFIKLERTKLPASLIRYQTHVSVTLSNILKEFIAAKEYEPLVESYQLLTENELEILQCLRNSNLKEVRIKLNADKEISLELSKLRTDEEREAMLLNYLQTGAYQVITYTTENVKIVKFGNSIEAKIK